MSQDINFDKVGLKITRAIGQGTISDKTLLKFIKVLEKSGEISEVFSHGIPLVEE